MRWLESQIKMRERLDSEMLENSYALLAASVLPGMDAPVFKVSNLEAADAAVREALAAIDVNTTGEVPADITDLEQRMDHLCRPQGVMRRTVRLDGAWYKNAFGVLLGKLKTGEPVALLPRTLGGYHYREPGSSKMVKLNQSTAKLLEEEAVLFYRPLPSKPLTIRDLLSFISSIFDRRDYFLILVAAIISSLIGLLPAWANNVAFGLVVPSGQASLIPAIGCLLLGVSVSSILINVVRDIIMARVTTKLQSITEAATFARVLSLPTSFFKTYASGNLASRVSQVTLLTQQLASMILGTGLSVFLSLIYIVQAAFYAPALVLPAFLVAAIQSGLTAVSTLVAIRFQRESMHAGAKLSGTVTALLNGVSKIKLAGAEDRAFARWARDYSVYAKPTYSHPAIVDALPAFVSLVGILGTTAIYFFAGSTHMSVANYMSFNVSYGQVVASITALAGVAAQIAQIRPMLEMVSPILEATPETADDKPAITTLTGGIEVSNISFRYEEGGQLVLKNLSFKVKPGEYVALVGKSGCGKSTIMRLLLGFETPEHGTIFYGPHDISKVDLRSLRHSIGTVMQDGKLFMGDIYSNITISNPSATIDDAWEAAEIAGIADDIRRMPMGMQTIVTEGGGGVSGGQRQRLMIARAVCGNRRILMLDEATSALDNVTQKHVSDSLDNLKCTRVVVAHRLSTVRHCDRILVVDDGHIAEEGTYEELIAKDGLFAELVARQRLDKEG